MCKIITEEYNQRVRVESTIMKKIRFDEHKEQIKKALDDKLRGVNFPGESDGFILVEGFINVPLQQEISNNMVIGGPNIPMVAIVGNKTGRIYYFALKALINDIDLSEDSNDS